MISLSGIIVAGLAASVAWSWWSRQRLSARPQPIAVRFTPEEDRLLAWAEDVVLRFMALIEARRETGVLALPQSALPGSVDEIKKALVIVALLRMRDPETQLRGKDHVKQLYSAFLHVYTQLNDVVPDDAAARAQETMTALAALRPDSSPQDILSAGKLVAKNKDDFAFDSYLRAPDLAAEFHKRVTKHIKRNTRIGAV